MSIYPNPATDIITLKNGTEGQFKLFNVKGQLVLNHNTVQADSKLDISNLPKGLYIYELNNSYTLYSSYGDEMRIAYNYSTQLFEDYGSGYPSTITHSGNQVTVSTTGDSFGTFTNPYY